MRIVKNCCLSLLTGGSSLWSEDVSASVKTPQNALELEVLRYSSNLRPFVSLQENLAMFNLGCSI